MKKLFLKSFALVAMLLCGLTASASAVDWSTIEWAGNGSSNGALNNKYKLAVPDGSNVALVNIQQAGTATEAGFYLTFPDAAFGEFRIAGEKTNYAIQGASAWLYVSNFTAKETEVQVMNAENNAVRWTLYVYYEDGIETGGEEKETIKPTMTSAELVEESVTYNSVVINVAGTDKEAEDGKDVAVTRFKVDYGETTKTYTATDGKITITGLTPGKTYSFTIYAVDAAGNVSKAGLTVEATTANRDSQCSGECGHFGNPSVKRIAYTIAYDPTEKAVVYTISALNEKKLDFMEVQNTKGSYRVDIPTNDSTTCTFTQTGLTAGEELGIRFHYSTDEIGGNELTAEQISMSDPNIIYYKVGDCAMEIVEDTEKPVMVEATFASATYTSITLNVSATDNVAVKRYHVVTTGVDKDILPANNQIVITGLTAGTTYTIEVSAKDAVGNESDKVIVPDVKTLSYPAAPAAPVHAQDKVFSIYSDAYNSTVTRVTGSWGQQTKEQEVALAEGDNAFFYTNCNYLGWELNGSTTIGDMSLFPNLHMDIYVPEAGSIKFTPIWGAEAAKEYSLVQGWNALDIDLAADFANINLKNINQLKWDAMPAVCFIDNVYFWKNGTSTQLDAAAVATNVSKMIENGQVVIIREGVKYDVTGRAIK